MRMSNGKYSESCGLIPPTTATDGGIGGFVDEAEQTITEELHIERQREHDDALRDAVLYAVTNILDGAGIDIPVMVHLRHRLSLTEVNAIVMESESLIAVAVAREQTRRITEAGQQQQHDSLVSAFSALGLRIEKAGAFPTYNIFGIGENRLRAVLACLSALSEEK